jgi:hypothetical protein
MHHFQGLYDYALRLEFFGSIIDSVKGSLRWLMVSMLMLEERANFRR